MSLRLSNWKWEFILALLHHLQLSDLQIEHLVTLFCPLSYPLPFRHLTAAAISKASSVLLCEHWPPQKPLPSFQLCPIPELYAKLFFFKECLMSLGNCIHTDVKTKGPRLTWETFHLSKICTGKLPQARPLANLKHLKMPHYLLLKRL